MSKWIVLISFLAASCMNEPTGPEGALKSFVESRSGTVVTREFVLERVTGKMYQSFENMSEVDFNKYADLRNIKNESFKILSKSCQEKRCFITYTVSYVTKEKDTSTFNSEVKKIAEVVSENGKWLISDVSNIKTYHEALEPINPLE